MQLNLTIALVIAESHYASGVIVARFLEEVIIIMELNRVSFRIFVKGGGCKCNNCRVKGCKDYSMYFHPRRMMYMYM